MKLSCRLPYNELCLQVPEGKFRQGLCRILATLFDIMSSYYEMMVWHQTSEVRYEEETNVMRVGV